MTTAESIRIAHLVTLACDVVIVLALLNMLRSILQIRRLHRELAAMRARHELLWPRWPRA